MADSPFVAEIRIFSCNFAPQGWAICAGQLLPITQNTALFSLLGTTYGGDGKSTFALPNLQGNVPIHQGQGQGLSERFLGEEGGESTVTLLQSEIPQHNHIVNTLSANGTATVSNGNMLGTAAASGGGGKIPATFSATFYSSNTTKATTFMSPPSLSITGNNLPHNNMMPYLGLTFCIAMQGVFPPRT
jgi:microcystin-dependent protein